MAGDTVTTSCDTADKVTDKGPNTVLQSNAQPGGYWEWFRARARDGSLGDTAHSVHQGLGDMSYTMPDEGPWARSTSLRPTDRGHVGQDLRKEKPETDALNVGANAGPIVDRKSVV